MVHTRNPPCIGAAVCFAVPLFFLHFILSLCAFLACSQAKLEELEREVNMVNANNDRLQRSYSELTELQVRGSGRCECHSTVHAFTQQAQLLCVSSLVVRILSCVMMKCLNLATTVLTPHQFAALDIRADPAGACWPLL